MSLLEKAKDFDQRNAGTRYDTDLHAWAHEQAKLLREGRLDEIDAANIAEELSDVANREYDKLESALAVVLMHLLEWDHQPEKRSRSWANSITEHRRRAARFLRKHPSLKSRLGEAVEGAYEDAVARCATETGVESALLPWSCPYDWAAIMDREIAWSDSERTVR